MEHLLQQNSEEYLAFVSLNFKNKKRNSTILNFESEIFESFKPDQMRTLFNVIAQFQLILVFVSYPSQYVLNRKLLKTLCHNINYHICLE